MDANYHIRKATPQDAYQIANVQTLSWQTTYTGIVEDSFLVGLNANAKSEFWSTVLDQKHFRCCVATIQEEIVGFISGGKSRSKLEFESEIYALYLLLHHQSKGIGAQLFNALCVQLREDSSNSLMVWVLKENPARLFYKKMGGVYLEDAQITIGKKQHIEEAYGWADLSRMPYIVP